MPTLPKGFHTVSAHRIRLQVLGQPKIMMPARIALGEAKPQSYKAKFF